MENIDYYGFVDLYGEEITERDFSRLSFEAFRVMDDMTTGVDGFRKLRYMYPTECYDAEAVRRCAYEIIRMMHQIEVMEASAGYVTREDGTVMNKRVSSVSSGSESISYVNGGTSGTAIEAAVADRDARRALFSDTVKKYLSGIKDAHGVNLLYMGVYHRV